jgi:plastocyanin
MPFDARGRVAMRLIRVLLVACALSAIALVAAPIGRANAADAVTVRIGADGIDPAQATVEPGGTVVWVNDASSPRSVVARDASFDSGPLAPGEQFQFAFTEARTATYDVPESGDSGTVTVAAAAATAVPGGTPVTAAPTNPTSPTAPTGFAYTGSSTAVNALIGGTILALGAGLLISARRFGLAGALTGLPFALVPDDLLPTRRHRRLRKERTRRPWEQLRR